MAAGTSWMASDLDFGPTSTNNTGIAKPFLPTFDMMGDWDNDMGATGSLGSGMAGDIAGTALGKAAGWDGKLGFGGGRTVPTLQLALQGLGTIGSLLAGFKQLGLAKKQFRFQKDFANTNLANQIQSYNTSLADRARARYAFEDRPASEADAYIAANKLPERTVTGRRP